MPMSPKPDSHGWYEPILGRAPTSWPWALPHLYAVNVAADPTIEFFGASATPDGSLSLRQGYNPDRTRIEIIGFWRNSFRVVDVDYASNRKQAGEAALNDFSCLPIRCFMQDGQTVRENPEVQITGEWPGVWKIQRYQDLGVLCAFIFEQTKRKGLIEAAEDFRRSIRPASPITEQVMVYEAALARALNSFSKELPPNVTSAISGALETIQSWHLQNGRLAK